MSILIDFLEKLPKKNASVVALMINCLSEDNLGFIEDYLKSGIEIPGNIIQNINAVFKDIGFPQYTWNNCHFDTSNTRFDDWLDEVSIE